MNERGPINESLLSQTRFLLQKYDMRAKKGLGQNFLVNPAVLDKIARAAELTSSDIVIEVGPGPGVLTRRLVESCGHVIAVELDSRMIELLQGSLGSPANFTLVNRDILEIAPADLIEQTSSKFSPGSPRPLRYKLVANLPYYITQPIIRHFCETRLKPLLMVLMVQKEVARNITAAPGDLSILGVAVQFYGKPKIVDTVPAGNFYPAPKVDSAILKIEMYEPAAGLS
jgi:16S rRNA (adenine1518-N6/adenine1519-N6)-dimethyltransferase